MGSLRDTYLTVEGWLELGNFREAELEFQKLPARAVSTKRGLSLWLKLSLGLERWAEVEAAASQLRAVLPQEAYPVMHEAEALHQQGLSLRAVAVLAAHAGRFTGAAWPGYLSALRSYVSRADLPEPAAAAMEAILSMQEGPGEPTAEPEGTPESGSRHAFVW